MKSQYHLFINLCVTVFFLVGCFALKVQATPFTTTELDVFVVNGATRKVQMETTSVDDAKNTKKKIASVVVKDYCVTIKGLKKGKTTVTFSVPEIEKQYKINITVLSKACVNKKVKKALKRYLKKCSKGTKYAFVDLNNDGIEEILFNKKIVYYNYETEKISTLKHNFASVYKGKKNDKIYAVLRKQRKTKEFVYIGEFFIPDYYKVFGLEGTGVGFRKYTNKGKAIYNVSDDYSYYDFKYDQDDYEYEAFSKNVMKQKITETIPNNHKVKMKKK